jgi:hypothetical protein
LPPVPLASADSIGLNLDNPELFHRLRSLYENHD